jgi:hypothetical protein
MIQRILYLILILAMGSACGSKKTEANSAQEPEAVASSILPPDMAYLSADEVNALLATAQQVDIIFYNHPVSVSQEDAASVQNTVRYILPTPPSVTTKCAPLGRLAWMADGVILKEADIYMGNGCTYLLFMEKNQPVAANTMANEGVQFFTNILSQVNQRQQQMQQQQQQQ